MAHGSSIFLFLNIYLFTDLAAPGLSCSMRDPCCSMWNLWLQHGTLSCSLWDLAS